MALTQAQLAELIAWVNAYAARTDQLSRDTATAVLAVYAGENFWSAASASAVAEQAADLSNTANLFAAGLASQYLGHVLSSTVGSVVAIPNLPLPPIRNGVALEDVFDRPMKLFRRKVSEGMEPAAAFDMAMRLAAALVDGNIRLAKRDETAQILSRLPAELGVTGYRRVVHPELSETGSCGLCIVASDVVYHKAQLMPLHGHCKCEVVPIIGDVDPGNSLNNLELGHFYSAAGSTDGRALKETRVQVNEHGEWGPVLTRADQHFTGPDELAPAA
jgi:hypothetical protein